MRISVVTATVLAALLTYGQHLVDEALAIYQGVVILAVHAQPRLGAENVIVASNIGRIGKKADADDRRVITTKAARFEFNKTRTRYSVEEPLVNEAGSVIGALGVSFPYRDGDNLAADRVTAAHVQSFFAERVSSGAQLMQPYRGPRISGSTEIAGYRGDFDHFAVDVPDNRLFLAGEDGAELDVFNLHSGALLARIKGFGTPHSPFYLPQLHAVLVVDADRPSQVRNPRTLALERTVALPAGADSGAYDPSTGHLWVVTGGKDVAKTTCTLIQVDPSNGHILTRTLFRADHVEAVAPESHGTRLFVNVTAQNRVAVVDKRSGAILNYWPVTAARQNAPLALDEVHNRLFVVTRQPGMLAVLDTEDGKILSTFRAPDIADQAVWDSAQQRLFVPGGDGTLEVFSEQPGGVVRVVDHIRSMQGAKTAIFVPQLNRLYVAVSPGVHRVGGRLIWFDF